MDNTHESLTYVSKEPDVDTLRKAYASTTLELASYIDLCRTSYDDRRNYWPGKSRDLRRHGSDAFPWEGASDTEAHVIDERINRLVALVMSSLNRANVRAYPTEASDIARAKIVSSFMKWMSTSGYIPRFKREMELGANYFFERGLLITYVGWHREDRTYLQQFSLEQIAQAAPDLANAILAGNQDDQVIQLLKQSFPTVQDKRAKKALAQLRKTGKADLPIVRRQVDAPMVKTLSPDGDFFFPPYVTDPQRAPYCFWKTFYTAQELKNKVSTDDWDEEWVDYVIARHRGLGSDSVDSYVDGRKSISLTTVHNGDSDLIEVIYGYQRLIDEDDNSEGIYCTVFHRDFSGTDSVNGYAKFELLNGYEDYPVVVTRLSEDSKRLYDIQTIPDLLRGIQQQVKIERDSRIDRNSLATLPPIMHPIGNAPSDWGPGRYVPYKRAGEFQFGPVPAFNAGSVEMEQTMQAQADRLVGLDVDNPLSQVKQQFMVDKFLSHAAEVLGQCYRAFQRFGPDNVFFQVTGVADPQQFSKGNPDENYDTTISYDVLNHDPESQETKLQQLVSLIQLDRNGRINVDALLDVIAASIDPVLASTILQPAQQAQEQIVKQVTDDLTKISASIEMPARPNGAQVAMQVIQQYTQQPDVQQRLAQDEAFKERLEKYHSQYTFMMQQAQNAEIGKFGTAPASMGGMTTQGMSK
jgi:hypothetical protein